MNAPQDQKISTPFQSCLVTLRLLTPLGQGDLGIESKTSKASVNRWERGSGLPKRDNVELLGATLEKYGVENATKKLLMAHRQTIDGTGLPEWARNLKSIEPGARHLMVVTPAMVPGYLQCPELARLLFKNAQRLATDDELDQLVSLRTNRLMELPELQVVAVFPASAVRALPGELPAVQAAYLIEWVNSGRVSVHLVPEETLLLGPTSPVMLFRMQGGELAVVTDHADGNVTLEDHTHERLEAQATNALAASLPLSHSLEALRTMT